MHTVITVYALTRTVPEMVCTVYMPVYLHICPQILVLGIFYLQYKFSLHRKTILILVLSHPDDVD